MAEEVCARYEAKIEGSISNLVLKLNTCYDFKDLIGMTRRYVVNNFSSVLTGFSAVIAHMCHCLKHRRSEEDKIIKYIIMPNSCPLKNNLLV